MDKANLPADLASLTPGQRDLIARRSAETDTPGADERFRNLLQKVVTVPKAELDRREAEQKTQRAKAA